MIENKLIIIPFGLDWNWPADYEKQTALTLAHNNTVIAFLPNKGLTLKNYLTRIVMGQKVIFLKKIKKNLWAFSPFYFLPLQKIKIIEKINFFLAAWQARFLIFINKDWRQKQKILWLFTSQLSFPPAWFGKNFFPLYDCVDLVTSLNPARDLYEKKQERKIVKLSEIVFTNSFSLFKLKKNSHKKVFLVPQGFNLDLFLKIKKFSEPNDLSQIPHPRIGFIGTINFRLDFNLIRKLSLENPDHSFIFIGPLDPDKQQDKVVNTQKELKNLAKIKNIYFLGSKLKKQIAAYIYYLDFGFIPYDIKQEFNRLCYPMKVFEYFYMGKPVISTPIEELKRYPQFVKIGKNAQEFEKHINNILKLGWPKKYQEQQKKLAIANSWQAKIEKISQILKENKYRLM